jgi:hypothetical protein
VNKGKLGINMVVHGGMFYLPVSLPSSLNSLSTWSGPTVAPIGPEGDLAGADGEEGFEEPMVEGPEPAEEHLAVDQGEEAAVARALPAAPVPSEEEKRTHRLTHLPYKAWCQACVAGKAKDNAHRRVKPREAGEPVLVELDYGFLRTEGVEDELSTVLVAIVPETGYGFAAKVGRKGNDPHAIKAICRWLDEAGLAGNPVELQTDAEASIQVVAREVATQRGSTAKTLTRVAPPGSHASQGAVERYWQTLQGQIRTLKLELESRSGMPLRADSPFTAWAFRHACWLCNRFLLRPGGKAPWTIIHGAQYDGQLMAFGQPCLARLTDALGIGRLEARWMPGVWLGRAAKNDCHVVLTANGIMEARSVKALEDPDRLRPELYNPEFFGGPVPLAPGAVAHQPVAVFRPEPAAGAEQAARQMLDPPDPYDSGPDPFWHSPGTSDTVAQGGGADVDTGVGRQGSGETDAVALAREEAGVGDTVPDVPEVMEQSGPSAAPSSLLAAASKRPLEPSPEAGSPTAKAKPTPSTLKRSLEGGEEVEAEGRLRELAQLRLMEEISSLCVQEEREPVLTTSFEFDPDTPVSSYVLQGYDRKQVLQAMSKEMQSIKSFDVFDEVRLDQLREGDRPIPCRWVITPKGDSLKARLVVQQVNTGEAMETFASTPTSATLKVALTIALSRGWSVFLADLTTAFLHAKLPEEERVVVRPPAPVLNPGHCWVLKRALYGLRKAPMYFQRHMKDVLGSLGMRCVTADSSMYVSDSNDLLMVLHVDDPLICGEEARIESFLAQLSEKVRLKRSGFLTCESWSKYLGMELRLSSPGGVYIRVPDKYWSDTVILAGLKHTSNGVDSPAATTKPQGKEDPELTAEEHALFRSLVGRLQWAVPMRPDLAFAVKECARAVAAPRASDLVAVRRVVRYLLRHGGKSLHLRPTEALDELKVYVDANWGGVAGAKDRRSTSGAVVLLGGSPVHFHSRTQSVTALSSCEAELYGLCSGSAEGLWIQALLSELSVPTSLVVYTDSGSALALLQKNGPGRLKHIEMRSLWVQESTKEGRFVVKKVLGTNNVSDIMTKALAPAEHLSQTARVGLVDCEVAESLCTLTFQCFSHRAPGAMVPDRAETPRANLSTGTGGTDFRKSLSQVPGLHLNVGSGSQTLHLKGGWKTQREHLALRSGSTQSEDAALRSSSTLSERVAGGSRTPSGHTAVQESCAMAQGKDPGNQGEWRESGC